MNRPARATAPNEAAALLHSFTNHLLYSLAKDQYSATARDRFMSLSLTIRDRLIERWISTQQRYYNKDAKRIYYLSAEFLMGRALANNLINLGLYETARECLKMLNLDIDHVLEEEIDAGLGNGGLGRLAACFLDSMATLDIPGYGYGIRYEFGMFDQEIKEGAQVEKPDEWLRLGNPWEMPRPEYGVPVRFGGWVEEQHDNGHYKVRWAGGEQVIGMPYDTPIAGYGCNTVNTLRLWRARASNDFDLRYFNEGDYEKAVLDKNRSETISKVLYPSDVKSFGKELRLRQQYFFVACSLHDIVRRHLVAHPSLENFSDKVAIQLNDTHPAVAIPELMRTFVDEHGIAWERAWELTQNTFGYTNHTLLSEALETWPVELFQRLLPRHLTIIYEINRRFLRQVMNRFPYDEPRITRRVAMCTASASAWLTWQWPDRIRSMAWRRCTPNCSKRICCATSTRCGPSASTTRPTASPRGAGCWRQIHNWRTPSPRASARAGSHTSTSWRSSRRTPTIRSSGRKSAPSSSTTRTSWRNTSRPRTSSR